MNFYIRGDVIPPSWYMHIKTEKGSTNFIACVILANILYWYRGEKKRFKADKLQKSYKEYVEKYGFTKVQVKKAFDDLERLGLITREWRTIRLQDGRILNNVMYVEPQMEEVMKISTPGYLEMTPSSSGDDQGVTQRLGDSSSPSKDKYKNYTRSSTRNTTRRVINLIEEYKNFAKNEKVIDAEAVEVQ